jgi:hypothetical protein
VCGALLRQTADLAAQAADMAATVNIQSAHPWAVADVASRLQNGGTTLAVAAERARDAAQREPLAAGDSELLAAIPARHAASAVPRELPAEVPALCDAVIDAARAPDGAAWTAAHLPAWLPGLSVTSWRRIATAGVATSHHCHVLLKTMQASAELPGGAGTARRLEIAAANAWLARGAWLRAARRYSEITTEVRWQVSRAAHSAAEVAFRAGRLAYADPRWTPSTGPNSTPHDLGEMIATLRRQPRSSPLCTMRARRQAGWPGPLSSRSAPPAAAGACSCPCALNPVTASPTCSSRCSGPNSRPPSR